MESRGKELLQEVLDGLPTLQDGKNVCLALSGGLDSTTLLYVLIQKYGVDRVKTLSFDFGQRHTIELKMAEETVRKTGVEWKVIKLDYFPLLANGKSALIKDSELKPRTAEDESGNPQPITYYPFRNLQFAAITAAFAESHDCSYIAQGIQASDDLSYWDTTLAFTEAVNKVLDLNRINHIQFVSPFVEIYKDEELRMARELSEIFGYDILETTWSCYNGYQEEYNYKECGSRCTTCADKILAYVQAGFTDAEIMNKFDVSIDYITNLRSKI